MITLLFHLLRLLPFLCGGHRQLALENLALRHRLAAYRRTKRRPKLRMTDRLFWLGLARVWAGWRQSLVIVTPATVLRWQRRRGETTDTATDDGHSESIRAHGLLRPRTQNKGHVRHQHELGRGLPPEPPRDLIAVRGGFMAVHAVATSLLSTRDNFEERASIRSGALML